MSDGVAWAYEQREIEEQRRNEFFRLINRALALGVGMADIEADVSKRIAQLEKLKQEKAKVKCGRCGK